MNYAVHAKVFVRDAEEVEIAYFVGCKALCLWPLIGYQIQAKQEFTVSCILLYCECVENVGTIATCYETDRLTLFDGNLLDIKLHILGDNFNLSRIAVVSI